MKKSPIISFTMLGLLSLTTQAETLTKNLAQCRVIPNSIERLACFDGLADQTTKAISSTVHSNTALPKAKTSIDRERVTSKVDTFGAEHFKKPKMTEEELQIVLTVAKLEKDQYGKLRITFENGQYWKQTDNHHFRLKVGDSVVLKKGMLNSIYLKKNQSDSNKKIRVKRLK